MFDGWDGVTFGGWDLIEGYGLGVSSGEICFIEGEGYAMHK